MLLPVKYPVDGQDSHVMSTGLGPQLDSSSAFKILCDSEGAEILCEPGAGCNGSFL